MGGIATSTGKSGAIDAAAISGIAGGTGITGGVCNED
jgi:hypothetical protein